MTVEQLIQVLQKVEDKSQRVVTLTRGEDTKDGKEVFRGISKIRGSKDVLGTARVVLSDG